MTRAGHTTGAKGGNFIASNSKLQIFCRTFIDTMFADILAQCLRLYLYNVWRLGYTLFEDKYVSTMFWDMYTPCLKTCLHNIYIFWIHANIMFSMFQAYLHFVWIQVKSICLHQVDGIFTKCLKPYLLENDEI